MRDAGAARPTDSVSRLEPMEMPVLPEVRRALEDVDELLLRQLRVRVARAPPGLERVMSAPEPEGTERTR